MSNFSIPQWVELFETIGLTEQQMTDWHRLFETRYPDAHQSFLEWLGVDAAQIATIRSKDV